VEQGFADVIVDCVLAVVLQIVEPAGEVVTAGIVRQPGFAGQQPADHRPDGIAPREHPAEEVEDAHDIRSGRLVRSGLAAAGHRLAEEHPERPGHVERCPPDVPVAPDTALPVEAQQVHVAVLVLRSPGQVGDGVVLAVAVGVERAVRVIEQQALAIGVAQAVVVADDLVEGGGVLEREAAARARPCRTRPDGLHPPAPGCCRRSRPRRRASRLSSRPAC